MGVHLSLITGAIIYSITPPPEEHDSTPSDGRNLVRVVMFSGNHCNGESAERSVLGGGNRCANVPYPMKALWAHGTGCGVAAFSDKECRGTAFNVTEDKCYHDLVYKSVLATCSE